MVQRRGWGIGRVVCWAGAMAFACAGACGEFASDSTTADPGRDFDGGSTTPDGGEPRGSSIPDSSVPDGVTGTDEANLVFREIFEDGEDYLTRWEKRPRGTWQLRLFASPDGGTVLRSEANAASSHARIVRTIPRGKAMRMRMRLRFVNVGPVELAEFGVGNEAVYFGVHSDPTKWFVATTVNGQDQFEPDPATQVPLSDQWHDVDFAFIQASSLATLTVDGKELFHASLTKAVDEPGDAGVRIGAVTGTTFNAPVIVDYDDIAVFSTP